MFGEPHLVNQANKMTFMLMKQDRALLLIESEAKKRGIDIGETHK